MTAPVLVAVTLAGGAGAVGRVLLTGAVSARAGAALPWGTLAVNLVGAFALGVLTGAHVGTNLRWILAIGLIGAFSTFSTWVFDSARLAEAGRPAGGAANLVVSLVLGVAVAWAGRELGLAL